MKVLRYATIATCLSLSLVTVALAQGGGASGAPSNNPPGTSTNAAGNAQPGGMASPSGGMASPSGMATTDGMNKPSKSTGMKKMRRSKAASSPSGSASMAK